MFNYLLGFHSLHKRFQILLCFWAKQRSKWNHEVLLCWGLDGVPTLLRFRGGSSYGRERGALPYSSSGRRAIVETELSASNSGISRTEEKLKVDTS